MAEEIESKVCPACGAFVDQHDTSCSICGAQIEEEFNAPQAVIEPEAEADCPECGAQIAIDSDNCPVCGEVVDLKVDIAPEIEEEAHSECPECGALQENGGDECFLCGAAIPIITPDTIDEEPSEEVEAEQEVHNECPECGALQDNGSDECFLCGASIIKTASISTEKITETVEEPGDEDMSPDADISEEEVPEAEPEMEPDGSPIEEEMADVEETVEAEPVEAEVEEPVEAEVMETETIAEQTEEAHIECHDCGASLDADAKDCFLCGTVVIADGAQPIEDAISEEELEGVTDETEVIEETIITEEETIEVLTPEDDDLPPLETSTPEDLSEEMEDVVDGIIEEEVPQLADDEMKCPSCSSTIKRDVEKCTECWADLSLYIKCGSCDCPLPVDTDTCPNCFAVVELIKETTEEVSYEAIPEVDALMDIDIDDAGVTEELEKEMSILDQEDEDDKECLVCGAHFGPDDEEHCPICGVEYGIEIAEEIEPEKEWDGLETLVQPTAHICPSCGEKVIGLDRTPRKVNEDTWFYRGIITIFIGIFFTSFSVWLRGISVESQSVGGSAPPFDVVASLAGWVLVLIGFAFWFISYRIGQELIECPQCSVEVSEDMTNCINCNLTLIEEEEKEYGEEDELIDDSAMPEDADIEALSEQILADEVDEEEILEEEVFEETHLEISEADDLDVIEEDLGLDIPEEVEDEPVLDEPEIEEVSELELPEEEIEDDLNLNDLDEAEAISTEPIIEEPLMEEETPATIEEALTEDDLAAPFETDDPIETEPEAEEVDAEIEPVETETLEAEPESIETEIEEPVETEALEAETIVETTAVAVEEEHVDCGSCGASLEAGSTECFLCGEVITPIDTQIEAEPDTEEIAEPELASPDTDIPEEDDLGAELPTEHEDHKKCPGCGIFVDLDAGECPVCDTLFDGADIPQENGVEVPMIEAEPDIDIEDSVVTEEPSEEEHVDCSECGASLDADSTECFLCGAMVGTVEEEKKECPACGAIVGSSDIICPICDESLV